MNKGSPMKKDVYDDLYRKIRTDCHMTYSQISREIAKQNKRIKNV